MQTQTKERTSDTPRANTDLKRQIRQLRYERNRFADLHTVAINRNVVAVQSLYVALSWLEALRPLVSGNGAKEHEARIESIKYAIEKNAP